MAKYIYQCKNCNKDIEVVCHMKEYSSTAQCECGEMAERKIEDLLPQNYIVKCDGFYGGGGKSKF